MRETGRKVERIGDKRERPREKEMGETEGNQRGRDANTLLIETWRKKKATRDKGVGTETE